MEASLLPVTTASAVISSCGAYRYHLTRRWRDGPLLTFVMLNPSIADAEIDDPTIRRCMHFARREDAAGIDVVNLLAFRATRPEVMMHAVDPSGPENFSVLAAVARDAKNNRKPIICAWGAHWMADEPARQAVALFQSLGVELKCLGKTQDGAPRHPLYVRNDQPLEPYP